ncbi:MAG: glutamate racemase [Actinomycetaceae bacterium]|nr:glutamate racemase [Actinomycetaceae bacterium]
MDSRPIGIFDSGVGGLTVARAVMDKLPSEQILYVGDTANSPYGTKSIAQVRELALNVMDSLAKRDVKMLVIACNTASAAVLRDARERYEVNAGISVVEVIQPAARRAALTTKTGRIGVIGTEATVNSGAYLDALSVVPGIEVVQAAAPKFVEFAEAGITTGDEVLAAAREYLAPIKAAEVDTLVLGCTHYPLLSGAISYVMGDDVQLVSSSESAARDVYRRLVEEDKLRDPALGIPEPHFSVTGDEKKFAPLAQRFLGPRVGNISRLEVSQ